ncbi:MAG: enhanced serine sensitivity protein SseB C-terminal domain-containing protein [Lachnospiraceae bacterium]|uniref:Enhanced serine sensitivity protein SseB n=1 Tax=Candidatus Enterocloster excrementigallinarum TaxID=2838558 RepID=A0A9D2PQI9_9FIRM|nr:enhanced serine sensitivity protein SseB C-terminal domain-containing protein [Lachnospiraceae bacterium]HJC65418.1 enhanced serine sensitivity protein SseB [Candidatus Enterocloster excrementigallinarum]
MADIKELKNQDLIMAYHLMQYNATPERQAEFMQEVVKARFLAPASFDPEPETGEDGKLKLQPNTKVSFPEVANNEGKKYLPAFTDWKSAQKWELKEGQRLIATNFEDYAAMVLRDQDASGFVINPFEENIRIERNVIAAIKQQQAAFIKQKLAEAQKRQAEQKVQAAAGQGNGAAGQPAGQQGQSAPGQAQRTVTLSFHRIEKCPEKFLEEARTYLKTQPVKKAYLQGLMQGDRKGCLFVLDHEGDEKALFNELAKISKPYMPGMYLYATTVNSDLGKKAINGMEPFYEA